MLKTNCKTDDSTPSTTNLKSSGKPEQFSTPNECPIAKQAAAIKRSINKKITDYFTPLPLRSTAPSSQLPQTPTKKSSLAPTGKQNSLTPSSLLSARLQNALKFTSTSTNTHSNQAELKQSKIDDFANAMPITSKAQGRENELNNQSGTNQEKKSLTGRFSVADSLVTQAIPQPTKNKEQLEDPFQILPFADATDAFIAPLSVVNSMKQMVASLKSCSSQIFTESLWNSAVQFTPLLPSVDLPINSQKKTLVLDLDETLIHCVTLRRPETFDFEFQVLFKGETLRFWCKVRPFMREFLESLKDLYEIVIFTASQQPYADALLDILDPQGVLFHHRLFRTACTFTQGYYVKHLGRLGRPIEHTVIVDNSPQSFLLHVENGIPITSWFGDLDDTELLKLRAFLQEMHAEAGEDVRDFLRKKFEWIS